MLKTTTKNATALLLGIMLDATGIAIAVEKAYPMIKVECDRQADVLTITNTLLKGETGANFKFSAADGTYSVWDMVEVAHQTDTTRIIKSSKTSTTCVLSSGEYNVVLEPQIFSNDVDSRCRETISGAVTVRRDGLEVLGRTAFEEYCHGDRPIITRITVFGETGDYKIKHIAKDLFY